MIKSTVFTSVQIPFYSSFQKRSISNTMKKASSKKWMQRHVNDHFVKQAKLQRYRSRSAFKLIEIDQRFNLFKPGMRVIDVGAAPGGWSQVIADRVDSVEGEESVVAADLLDMVPIPGVKTVQGDIRSP